MLTDHVFMPIAGNTPDSITFRHSRFPQHQIFLYILHHRRPRGVEVQGQTAADNRVHCDLLGQLRQCADVLIDKRVKGNRGGTGPCEGYGRRETADGGQREEKYILMW